MKHKIFACVSVYNNGDYIRATLESIIRFVDHIIIVDGRYATYPGDSWCSTDETLPTIHLMMGRYPGKITLIPARQWQTQVEKRNAYLDLVPTGEWVMVIDGDEILQCRDAIASRKEIESHYDEGRAMVKIEYYSNRYRFFVKREGLKYTGYHWNIVDPATGKNIVDLIEAAFEMLITPMATLHYAHMKHQRNEQVALDKAQFYQNRFSIEQPNIVLDQKEKAKNKEFMKKIGIEIK